MHPAMRHVAPVRAKLGIRTIFNLLGPLSNPAGAAYQLLGTGSDELRQKLADALLLLNIERAVLITGEGGLGEVNLSGATAVTIAEHGSLRELIWSPKDFGIPSQAMDSLEVEDAQQSAAIIRDVLDGRPGPAREMVVLNAAAALWTAGKDESLEKCAALAAAASDGGAAKEVLKRLVVASNS
jgi:anthranilate phosphoribosyltransferase